MKSGFWKTDWFFGLVVALVMLLLSNSILVRNFERVAYDAGASWSARAPLDRIAVIAIDDASVAALGQWPWSRDIDAKMTDILVGAKAKVIASTGPLSEAQVDPGYKYVTKLLELSGVPPALVAPPGPAAGSPPDASPAPPPSGSEQGPVVALLREAEGALNADRRLAESISRSGNVLLPMTLTFGDPAGRPAKPLPDYMKKSVVPGAAEGAKSASGAKAPIESIGSVAGGVGYLGASGGATGAVRSETLVIRYMDRLYPSLALLVAARSLGIAAKDIKIQPGSGVSIGDRFVHTDNALVTLPYSYGSRDGNRAFQADSFLDVYSGKIDAAKKYGGKIVLVGAPAAGDALSDAGGSPVLVLANSVSSILQGHGFVAPDWGWIAEKAVFALIAAYLILLLPRLSMVAAAASTSGVLVALLAIHFLLMTTQGIWLQLMASCALLVFGHVALLVKRIGKEEGGKTRAGEPSADANRMLALAYQGQGQLDLAWDKFKLVPLSDQVMNDLYVLGLDFEKKTQPAKAEIVFRHIAAHNPKFRDLETRLSSAKHLSETVILGNTGPAVAKKAAPVAPAAAVAPVVPAAAADQQMLGRYAIERELGKGAMGVVYQGKDPKIGRVVAIKTMALAQEFEPDELAEVKERFFREAETAGRLAHQNIVTIYDAGEERGLAFIAMEMLKGGDLGPYTKPGALLPIEKVISIIARTADALGYAHKQGVVHRDIKPANIMYHLESDTVKVTDFGIARLTDSSKTKTGMVLGTPSFMSPEQLAGQKIDGRSDLFSLAGTLYQMLCGKLPFEGSSMGRLMFNISSEPPADIRSINPNVPLEVVAFLDRAMKKEPDGRFQTGDEFAAALRAAAEGGGAKQPAPNATASTVDIQL
jgi:CHASE2 domain-containing sensor protein/tRNA A-37 threonylcarbamoyl transferase component Bud32